MSCFDCKKFHHKCKACCCCVFPMDKDLYEKNKDKRQRPVVKEVPWNNPQHQGLVLPMTESGQCPFLCEDYSCAIYEERPKICRDYGNETHDYLCCPVQDKDGKARSRQGVRSHLRKSAKGHTSFIKSLERQARSLA